MQKFEAEVLKSQSLEFDILQKIKETENRINFLTARYPQRDTARQRSFPRPGAGCSQCWYSIATIGTRPDIKQAELQLAAAKLDVKVARAEFYPSLGISAALGLQAFKPSYLVKLPESVLYLPGR